MANDIVAKIRKKTIGATKETTFDIRSIETSVKIPGVSFLRASHQFNIDPVPWDNWIVDGEKVRPGREIIDLLKEKEFVPNSKEEAIETAKLVLILESGPIRIYPDFNAKGCKKPSVSVKDGVYEVVMFISYGFYFQPPRPLKIIFRIGKEICEVKRNKEI